MTPKEQELQKRIEQLEKERAELLEWLEKKGNQYQEKADKCHINHNASYNEGLSHMCERAIEFINKQNKNG